MCGPQSAGPTKIRAFSATSAATTWPWPSVEALVERSGIDPAEIEDVVLGNTQQQGEQGLNVARIVGLMAGLPGRQRRGTTINRLCGSSLQAINQATHAIMAGCEDVQIVGGLEHMQHIADGRRRRLESQALSPTQPRGP